MLLGEAIRDVQYAQVNPDEIDLLAIPLTEKRLKWHSFSGPFLLLKRRSSLEFQQLRKIVSIVLALFSVIVIGKGVRSFVRT